MLPRQTAAPASTASRAILPLICSFPSNMSGGTADRLYPPRCAWETFSGVRTKLGFLSWSLASQRTVHYTRDTRGENAPGVVQKFRRISRDYLVAGLGDLYAHDPKALVANRWPPRLGYFFKGGVKPL